MNGTPLWKQYGFASEAEFNKRHPNAGQAKHARQPKPRQPSKKRKRKSRVMPRH